MTETEKCKNCGKPKSKHEKATDVLGRKYLWCDISKDIQQFEPEPSKNKKSPPENEEAEEIVEFHVELMKVPMNIEYRKKIMQAARNLWKKANPERFFDYDFVLKQATVTAEKCIELHKELEATKEAGRQSAQKEVEKLNQQLISQGADFNNEVILLKKQLVQKDADLQEQVRKLQPYMFEKFGVTKSEFEVLKKEIFPDCVLNESSKASSNSEMTSKEKPSQTGEISLVTAILVWVVILLVVYLKINMN